MSDEYRLALGHDFVVIGSAIGHHTESETGQRRSRRRVQPHEGREQMSGSNVMPVDEYMRQNRNGVWDQH